MDRINTFKIGVSEKIITPKDSIPFGEVKWCGNSIDVHDDIFVKTIYFEFGKKQFLLTISDLMLIFSPMVKELRRKIFQATGIKENSVMIATTQNHSAPAMYSGDMWELPDYKGSWNDWFNFFKNQTITSCVEAMSDAEEVLLKISIGKAEGIAGNRRPIKKNGKVIMTWFRPKKEEIVDWGEEDPTVKVICVERIKDGFPKAIIFYFSCHPNCAWATRKISSDFYGVTCREIKKIFSSTIPIFINGCCGDIDPTKYMKIPKEYYNAPDAFKSGSKVDLVFEDIERFGKILSDAILKVMDKGVKIKPDSLKSKIISFCPNFRKKIPLLINNKFELQGFKIGEDIGFIGIPAEPFLKIQKIIEFKSPFSYTFIVGHANGYFGYIPCKEDFNRGGYGIDEKVAPLDINMDEILIQKSLQLLEYLKN